LSINRQGAGKLTNPGCYIFSKVQHWQADLLDKLVSYFEPNQDILGLLLFGSYSAGENNHDHWSDIDLLVVVKSEKLETFFPTIEWIKSFGELYTYDQSSDEFKCTTRACFEDFRRVDFVITTEEKLANIDEWSSVPFSAGARILFSRSQVVDGVSQSGNLQRQLPPVTEDQFLEMVRKFRFKSMLAVYKVVRNDLLIALHLSLDLIRDCSVLGMILRDRRTGTNLHKEGGEGNQLVAQLQNAQKPFTSLGILDSIKESNQVFETLAGQWSSDYLENHQMFFEWIEKAKVKLPDMDSELISGITVRDAEAADVPALIAIKGDGTETLHRDRLRDARDTGFRYLVLLNQQEIIGFACLVFRRPAYWSDGNDPHLLPQIVDLQVRESHRGQGYGSAFMQEIERIARKAGSVALYIAVEPLDNPRAYTLYQRLGYEQIQSEPYQKNWEFQDSEGNVHRGEAWIVDLVKQL
jgi:GNAT superfamily N-acetyltransferase/predicted nucleotidyltransferase